MPVMIYSRFVYCKDDIAFHGPFSEYQAGQKIKAYDEGEDIFYCGPHRIEKDYEKAERLWRDR